MAGGMFTVIVEMESFRRSRSVGALFSAYPLILLLLYPSILCHKSNVPSKIDHTSARLLILCINR